MERSAGILLPVFSLPGAYGIGTLGREARAFIDFLHTAGQRWWQVLPVGPTGAGDSPYTSVSTFAGNPLFIDPEDLADRGLLTKEDLAAAKLPWAAAVDYGAVYARRETLLRRAFSRLSGAEAQKVRNFAVQRPWLREYALYRALKARFHEAAWTDWPYRALRDHEAAAVEAARRELAEEIAYHEAVQFWFFSQWEAMKQYANGLGVKIIGDLPIYVSLDSADVWSERKEFLLDGDGLPARVAGVPPDYFSEEGQLWGNPLYDWAAMKADGFGWWIRRVEGASHLYDAIRIDHFRAFESYWSVPAGAESAKEGRWEKGPGMDLLGVLTGWFPNITYIAEDLGLLTPEVHQLRERAGLPGMKVLEFAFSGPDNAYLPHHYTSPVCICYAGTHDNDTALGWYDHAGAAERDYAERYLAASGRENVGRALLRCGMASTAELFVAQMQDYLGLGSEGRINVPGVAEGNWRWRMAPGAAADELAAEIRALTGTYSRC